jgi:hypothetical protein
VPEARLEVERDIDRLSSVPDQKAVVQLPNENELVNRSSECDTKTAVDRPD